MYKAVIFDFFGVLSTDPYNDWLARHSLNRVGEYEEISRSADEGKTTTGEFFARLSELSGEDPNAIKNDFSSSKNINHSTVAILKMLSQKGYKIGLMSNSSSSHLFEILKQNQIYDYFDTLIVSSDVGVAKPDPRIYSVAIDKLAVLPTETIFIDDNLRNLAPARELGIKTIHFTSAENLAKELDTIL